MDANTPEPEIGSTVRGRHTRRTWTCYPGALFDLAVPKVWACDEPGFHAVHTWAALWEHEGPLDAVAVQHARP